MRDGGHAPAVVPRPHLPHLPAVTSDQVRAGVMAGVVAAAATGGALAVLAWRAGDVSRPFVEIGRAALGSVALGGVAPLTGALLGVGLHVAVSIGWGLLLAIIARRVRGVGLLLASALVALFASLVHSTVLPAFRLGFGLGVFPLHGAPLVFLYLLFALALALGMRLAR